MTVAPEDPGKLLLCLESTLGAPQSDIELPPWLVELRECRARIAWNSGRRPDFRQTDGTFVDPDPHDLRAYHLMVRTDAGELIACCRYAPLEAAVSNPTAAERESCQFRYRWIFRTECRDGQTW